MELVNDMKCIILCAGYATRLYPLTKDFPKPLLSIKGKPLINYLIEDLEKTGMISEYIIVTNHKFVNHFIDWRKKFGDNILILDDFSTSNQNRLGAVKDIWYAIEKTNIFDDILVLAGDNLLDFSLKEFIDFSNQKQCNAIMCYYEPELNHLQRTGVANLDDDGKVISMHEKPENPSSNWAIPPFYIFRKNYLKEIKNGIDSGCKTDAPGEFIEWFCKRNTVYAYKMPGRRIDIGNLKDYYSMK